MKDFGTFDTLTDEEDTIYSRLAVIRRELDRLELEQNEAQQDIKMWYNKMWDDKFKVKFWLVTALILSIGAMPWHLLVLAMIPAGFEFVYAKLINIIATFLYLLETFMFLPVVLICVVIFLVWLVLSILRNSKGDKIKIIAENMGVRNRYMLIDEQKVIVGTTAIEMERLKEEEEKLKRRLESIQREKDA